MFTNDKEGKIVDQLSSLASQLVLPEGSRVRAACLSRRFKKYHTT
jgi:hypothetical protein